MFRIAKRDKSTLAGSIAYRIIGLGTGILLSMIFIAVLGYNPFKAMSTLLSGALGSDNAIKNTISFAIPLAITALGLAIAFRMKFWNIGGEGQFLVGAAAAMFVSLQMPESTPGWLLILLMFLAGFAGGAVWAVIPGFFRVILKTNETLFTLMMNYLAICLVEYFYYTLWKNPDNAFPGIKPIQLQAHLPQVFGISTGIVVPVILAGILFVLINRSKPGFEIRVVGESEPTAHYAGMNVRKIMLFGIMLSGGIVGLAGVIKLTGSTYSLTASLAGGAGFTAIVIAWLANLSAPIILIVSFLFGALQQGAQIIQLRMGIPAAVAEIMKGLLLMSILGSEFFLRYRFIWGNTTRTDILDILKKEKPECPQTDSTDISGKENR